jgi:hypothetical protein
MEHILWNVTEWLLAIRWWIDVRMYTTLVTERRKVGPRKDQWGKSEVSLLRGRAQVARSIFHFMANKTLPRLINNSRRALFCARRNLQCLLSNGEELHRGKDNQDPERGLGGGNGYSYKSSKKFSKDFGLLRCWLVSPLKEQQHFENNGNNRE